MTGNMNKYTYVIESRLDRVSELSSAVKEWARSFNWKDDFIFNLELSIIEIVNNCIQHGCKGESGYDIKVEVDSCGNELVVTISDSGYPWSGGEEKVSQQVIGSGKTAVFDFDPTDIKNLPEGGMGLEIVQSLVSKLVYERVNNINTFTLHFNLNSG
jgi:serine/threonine-protein kinase RsbW